MVHMGSKGIRQMKIIAGLLAQLISMGVAGCCIVCAIFVYDGRWPINELEQPMFMSAQDFITLTFAACAAAYTMLAIIFAFVTDEAIKEH